MTVEKEMDRAVLVHQAKEQGFGNTYGKAKREESVNCLLVDKRFVSKEIKSRIIK